ncbi:MAG: c-type cytochrome [Elusimicrobia bacterium]|nr:c-type cytochrome [Elusimicrobiota bacterium]
MSQWHEEYLKRYKRAKQDGKPFFPYTVFKDTVFATLLLLALVGLALWRGAPLEELADPTDTSYNPRPEWYFLFLFQALKLFPGSLEAVAAVLIPGLIVGALFLLPFLDRGPRRHPFDRPLWLGLGVLAAGVWGWLTWAGITSPLTNPTVERNPLVSEGLRLYRILNCSYCHKIGGKGGAVGPELDKTAANKEAAWLERHFRDPQSVSPGSPMPKLNLLDDEIKGLVAYMQSLGGGGPYSDQAPRLFADHCSACHRIGKDGGDTAPDLSTIGSARDKAYLRRYIQSPSKLNPDSSMPSYKDQLSDVEIEDLARYLASQRE